MLRNEKIKLIQGDITKLKVGAVVNAANSALKGGGGVDGAIHRAAGPGLHKECMSIIGKIGSCPPGKAVVTSAGDMPAKFVIHTVGPIWRGGKNNEEDILSECYTNSLKAAIRYDLKTIAFPNISTGVYGFPKPLAAEIAVKTILFNLISYPEFEKILFCCYDKENYRIYYKILNNL